MAPSLEGANLEDKSTSIERLSRYSQAEMRSHAVPKQKLVDKTNVDCSKKILNVEPTSETGSINEDKTRVDDDRLMKPCFNNIPGPKKAAKYSYDEDFKTSTESLERVWKGSGILNPDEFNNAKLLPQQIVERKVQESNVRVDSYNPCYWISLAITYRDLNFPEICTATVHRALTLIKHGLEIENDNPLLTHKVWSAISKLGANNPIAVKACLTEFHLIALKVLLSGLLDCASLWDGLIVAKLARKRFVEDGDLLILENQLRTGFLEKIAQLKEISTPVEDLRILSRLGAVNKVQYPWLPKELFYRTPELIKSINESFDSNNCTVKPLSSNTSKAKNVGPLGIFATKNTHQDEIVLIDRGITAVCNLNPTKLLNCEACHASLNPIHLPPQELRVASCCIKAAYCSQRCHDTATGPGGYHKVLCGKDFDWLYEDTGEEKDAKLNRSWESLLLLRVLAIIIADQRDSPTSSTMKMTHPLQHPLIAQLTAGYEGESYAEWSYWRRIEVPDRILTQLGVDIFTNSLWLPEVIQTIFFKVLNNACVLKSTVVKQSSSSANEVVEWDLIALCRSFMFFNHSCEETVVWKTTGQTACLAERKKEKGDNKKNGTPTLDKSKEVDLIRIGSSALICLAKKEIEKGAECTISYVPGGDTEEARQKQVLGLQKWFSGGCGCKLCAKDTQVE